jgi:hypothetical protein
MDGGPVKETSLTVLHHQQHPFGSVVNNAEGTSEFLFHVLREFRIPTTWTMHQDGQYLGKHG